MIQKQYRIWQSGEYSFPGYGNFSPSIMAYLHEDDEKLRPAILIAPGGGYYMVCPWEGENVAKEFYKKGYQAFVLTYTTNFRQTTPLHLQPLKDISRATVFIRKHWEIFGINASQVSICGFSAGGHLCGSFAVHFDEEELSEQGVYRGISNRPDAAILCYPLITTEQEYTHNDCLASLVGNDATQKQYEYISLEKHVTNNTPPIFLWHTATDELVPVENSLLFERACRKNNIPTELHIFSTGYHGISLANEKYMAKDLSSLYCMEQFFAALPDLIASGESIPTPFLCTEQLTSQTDIKEMEQKYLQTIQKTPIVNQTDNTIAMWPELVHTWLQKLFQMNSN